MRGGGGATKRRPDTGRANSTPSAPRGLVVDTFDLGGHGYALLEWAPGAPRLPPSLPRAEREIVELMLAGLSNADIARRRGRSPRTVAHQVDAIFRRLGVRSRLELFALLSREDPP